MAPSRTKSELPDITVFRENPVTCEYSWSPFITKLEVRLRLDGIKYESKVGSVMTAPKGKFPYLELNPASGDASPKLLADTSLITKELVENGLLRDLNAKLSPVQKAQDAALRSFLEDRLYFYTMHERWVENYYTIRSKLLQVLPFPVQTAVGLIIYRKITQTLHGQGTSRFTSDEIQAFRQDVFSNVNSLLEASKAQLKPQSKKPFWAFGGDTPTEADATFYGFIATAIVSKANPKTKALAQSYPVLVDYAERIHDTFFPEFAPLD